LTEYTLSRKSLQQIQSQVNMPTTRRSTGRASTGASGKAKTQPATQTKLAFHSTAGSNRISKRGADASTHDSKAKAKAKELEDVVDLNEETVTVPKPSPSVHAVEPVEILLDHGLGEEEEALSDEEEATETEARKVTKVQMDKYWQGKEKLMGAPRAHLERSSVAEKILREWDVDGRYGVSCFHSADLLLILDSLAWE
jgi:hypothetical protein